MIERAFADWQPAEIPAVRAPIFANPQQELIFLVDQPDMPQTMIQSGVIVAPRTQGDEPARRAANVAIGGSFVSRVNMKLREEKGWTYGARTGISGELGSRTFGVRTSVQTDRTGEAMAEIARLFDEAITSEPISAEEALASREALVLGLNDYWSTPGGIATSLLYETNYGLPTDYYRGYATLIEALDKDELQSAVEEMIAHKPRTWLLIGDRRKIEPQLRDLGIGQIVHLDADGKRVVPAVE